MFWICGIHLHGQLERGFGTRGFCVLFNRHIGVRIDHANDVNRTSSSFFLCIEWRKKKKKTFCLRLLECLPVSLSKILIFKSPHLPG